SADADSRARAADGSEMAARSNKMIAYEFLGRLTTANEVRRALRNVACEVAERFQADRQQIERLKSEIRDQRSQGAARRGQARIKGGIAARLTFPRRTAKQPQTIQA